MEYLTNDTDLKKVADAIREKTGGTDSLVFPDGFAEAIGTLSSGGEYINTNATEISASAFRGCALLTSVSFTKVKSIEANAFYSCNNLISAEFPAALSLKNTAFSRCTKLKHITLPALTSVSTQAFSRCQELEKIDFPALVSVPSALFTNCSKLTAVIFRNTSIVTKSDDGDLWWDGTPIDDGDGYIYVPSALVDSYKTSDAWSTYAAQIRAIEDYPDIAGG